MLNLLLGLLLLVAAFAVFWRVRPREGKPHPLVTAPWLESTIPVTITAAFVFGIALMIAGIGAITP
jgi:hypothetical protein